MSALFTAVPLTIQRHGRNALRGHQAAVFLNHVKAGKRELFLEYKKKIIPFHLKKKIKIYKFLEKGR